MEIRTQKCLVLVILCFITYAAAFVQPGFVTSLRTARSHALTQQQRRMQLVSLDGLSLSALRSHVGRALSAATYALAAGTSRGTAYSERAQQMRQQQQQQNLLQQLQEQHEPSNFIGRIWEASRDLNAFNVESNAGMCVCTRTHTHTNTESVTQR
jgi:hypothetical protein